MGLCSQVCWDPLEQHRAGHPLGTESRSTLKSFYVCVIHEIVSMFIRKYGSTFYIGIAMVI